LLALFMQCSVLRRQLARCISAKFSAALVKVFSFLYQFLAPVDQVIRDLFALAD
jgi:hypothetical protein